MDAIYMDFKKAFDSVPHERLLIKLRGYGIRGNILEWIRDFLSNRKQYVNVNNTKSKTLPVTSGVPQGSVLGPTLFIYFINDLPSVTDTPMEIFADDTKAFDKAETLEDQTRNQQCIDDMVRWTLKWLLGFNLSKCGVLHAGKNNPQFSYTIGFDKDKINLETSNSGRCNQCKRILRNAEQSFAQSIQERIGQEALGSKEFWQITKKVLGGGKFSIPTLVEGPSQVISSTDKASIFASKFAAHSTLDDMGCLPPDFPSYTD